MNLTSLNTQLLKEKNFFCLCKKHISLLLCCFCFIVSLHSQNNTTNLYVAQNTKAVGLQNTYTKTSKQKNIKIFIKDNTLSCGLNQLTNAQLIVVEVKRKFQTKISKQIIAALAQKQTTLYIKKNTLTYNLEALSNSTIVDVSNAVFLKKDSKKAKAPIYILKRSTKKKADNTSTYQFKPLPFQNSLFGFNYFIKSHFALISVSSLRHPKTKQQQLSVKYYLMASVIDAYLVILQNSKVQLNTNFSTRNSLIGLASFYSRPTPLLFGANC